MRCFAEDFVIVLHLVAGCAATGVEGEVVDSEHRVEMLIVEVDGLKLPAVVGQLFGYGIENGVVETLVVGMAIDDCNHDAMGFKVVDALLYSHITTGDRKKFRPPGTISMKNVAEMLTVASVGGTIGGAGAPIINDAFDVDAEHVHFGE